MSLANTSEQTLFDDVLIPFLREKWHDIDQIDTDSKRKDGRLTHDELTDAYKTALKEKRSIDAWILNEILKRYDKLCLSYDDGYWWRDESILGISEEDVSVYRQLTAIKSKRMKSKPTPKPWLQS